MNIVRELDRNAQIRIDQFTLDDLDELDQLPIERATTVEISSHFPQRLYIEVQTSVSSIEVALENTVAIGVFTRLLQFLASRRLPLWWMRGYLILIPIFVVTALTIGLLLFPIPGTPAWFQNRQLALGPVAVLFWFYWRLMLGRRRGFVLNLAGGAPALGKKLLEIMNNASIAAVIGAVAGSICGYLLGQANCK